MWAHCQFLELEQPEIGWRLAAVSEVFGHPSSPAHHSSQERVRATLCAKHLLTALLTLGGAALSSQRYTELLIYRASSSTDPRQNEQRRVHVWGGAANSWAQRIGEEDKFAGTSCANPEYIKKEKKAKKGNCYWREGPVVAGCSALTPPSKAFVITSPCHRSQATVLDGCGGGGSSSSLLCFLMTNASRTAKIKQVSASSTTRRETKK